MQKVLPRKFFITGTDTNCGKTLFACALLRAAALAGHTTAAIKPLAAGGVINNGVLQNEDALQLQAQSTLPLSYEQVNPICLPEALSPHLAAARAGRRVQADRLAGFCQGMLMQRAGVTVIEGAGGWRVPINDREYMSDLVRMLQLPVIMVVGMKLGCLNHALLTAEAIYRDGLSLAGWVANTLDVDMQCRAENLQTLQDQLPAPLLADLPFFSATDDLDQVASHVNLAVISL